MKQIYLIACVALFILTATACGSNEPTEEEIFQQALDTISTQVGIPNPLQPQTTEPTTTTYTGTATGQPTITNATDLELPIVVRETTVVRDSGTNRITHRITTTGELQRRTNMSTVTATWETIDTDVRSFALGGGALFYIKNDNTLWGLGSNHQGRLGDGTGVDRTEAVHILDNVAMVYNLSNIAYALLIDGTLLTWGRGNFSPIEVTSSVSQFLQAWHWGIALQKSTGTIHRISFEAPEESAVQALAESVLDVSPNIGSTHTLTSGVYYITSSNILMRRNYRQSDRGRGVFMSEEQIAIDVEKIFHFPLDFPIRTNGRANTFFITLDGVLYGIGLNGNGELGDGTRVPRPEPVRIAENVAYARPFMFLKNDGALWEWSQGNPTPQHTHDNIAVIAEHFIHFQDGRLLFRDRGRDREYEDVRVPRTLTFE